MHAPSQSTTSLIDRNVRATARVVHGASQSRALMVSRLRKPSSKPTASPCPYRTSGPARGGVACCSQRDSKDSEGGSGDTTTILLAIGALVLAGGATVGYPLVADQLEDLLYAADAMTGSSGWGPADLLAGLLWGLSLFYTSPLQQLLLFLGRIETERPSDWIIMGLARGPLGLDILDVNEAPEWLTGVAAGACLAAGLAISFVLQAGLGDSIWALSTGTGACLAAGVYELGRPRRLNRSQAEELDRQWRDFVVFANDRLVRSGRCHESEVATAFRRTSPRYRSPEALPDDVLRDLIRNWHPDADRTPNGFYRNMSLSARVDAFTGKVEGGSGAAAVVAVAMATRPQTGNEIRGMERAVDAPAAKNVDSDAGGTSTDT